MDIENGIVVPDRPLMMTREFEVCWHFGGNSLPVQITAFNGYQLLGVLENGQITAAIVSTDPTHGRIAGAERTFPFVQRARSWFFGHVGHAES